MSFGSVGSRVFMDDLVFQRIWLQRNDELRNAENDSEKSSEDDEDSNDIQKLFAQKKLRKRRGNGNDKTRKRQINSSHSGSDPPEWLAVFVGVFFVAGVAGIASYQAYKQDANDFSHMEFHMNDIAHDAPVDLDIYNDLFLPKALIPKNYLLYLAPNITAKKYTGLVKITVECREETGQVVIHSNNHKIRQVEIKPKNQSENHFKVTDTLRNRDRHFVIFRTDQTFRVGQFYDIFIGFGNALTYDTSHGFYLSDYRDSSGKKHTMVSSDFEPTMARNAFPCFDEPEMKATFKIILLNEKDFTAISNMPVKNKFDYGLDKVETHFEETPRMSTYLVVFIVTQYSYRETTSNSGVKEKGASQNVDAKNQSKVYAPEGRLQETEVALNVAPLCVNYYEQKFNVKFSLPKLDLIPITQLSASADETWGGIVFQEESLLYDQTSGSVNHLEQVASTIAHEIAHQWFGDLVSISWWNDLWLKESFASYLQSLPITKYYPSWDFKSKFYLSEITSALAADTSAYTHPIYTDVLDPVKLRLVYDEITYQKGAAVVAMLANFLGEETFFKGVNEKGTSQDVGVKNQIYLEKYAFKNADTAQFWEAISEAAPHVNVTEFMNSWVHKPGFPLLTIQHQGNGKFTVKQKRFTQSKDGNMATPEFSTWHVPLVIKSNDESKIFSTVFRVGNGDYTTGFTNLDKTSSWYKVNYGATGFYRVNYDDGNWKNLLKQLNENHTVFPVVDRANILNDISALALANYQTIDFALNFTSYLSNEHHYVPWEVGTDLLTLIHFVFYETPLKACVEHYMLNLIKPVLTYLNSQTSHDHVEKHLISYLLSFAVGYEDTDIVLELNNKFLKWVVSGSNDPLPSLVRSNVFRTGILYGESYEWDYMLKYYQDSSSSSERMLILNVITATRDVELIKKFLHILENTSIIPPWEQARAYQLICSNRFANQLAWKQFQRHLDEFVESTSSDPRMLSFILDACLSSGKTEAQLNVVSVLENTAKNFFDNSLPENLAIFGQKILEKIRQNIALVKRQSEIENWFKRSNPSCLVS